MNDMPKLGDYIAAVNRRYAEIDCQGDDKYKLKEHVDKKHNHYFKDVSNLKYIDVYRVIELYDVKHACIQHALKKLLVTGNRGHKDQQTDIQDAIDSLIRWKEMQEEDNKECECESD